jgi:hypothetical protein
MKCPLFLGGNNNQLRFPLGKLRFGDDGGREPRVPIPNTTVKPSSADGTWTAGSWESRTLPSRHKNTSDLHGSEVFFFLCCYLTVHNLVPLHQTIASRNITLSRFPFFSWYRDGYTPPYYLKEVYPLCVVTEKVYGHYSL